MPLADMGLVSRFDANDTAASGAPRRASDHASDRMVRCVAGFYDEARNVEVVAQALRAQFGLGEDTVTVIHPTGLKREEFDRVARRWQCLRPDASLGRLLSNIGLGALTGLVSGGTAASLGWVVTQGSESMTELLTWLTPGMWAGALAGAVTAAVMARRQPRHRFDETVARKLRRGFGVVVAHGLDERHEAPVLAYLQDTSHSWCAEAPQREWRL